MLSRRAFLIGGGAVVAAAGVGYAEVGSSRRQRLLHKVGLAASPDHHVPRSATRQESGTLASTFMHRSVDWTISVPDAPVAGVIFCLHGKGEDHHFAFDTIRLHDVVAAQRAPVATAAVDGGDDSYWHRRADGTDALGMLLNEFVPMVDRRLGVARRAVLGWSMGGYGALLTAETSPASFVAVAAASPALWTRPGDTAPGAFDNADDFRRHDVFAQEARLAGLTVRIDCGQGDPFFQSSRAFVARVGVRAQSSFGPGFHDPAYWRSVAPAQIATIAAAFGQ